MSQELEPMENPETGEGSSIQVTFQNKQEDLMSAIEVVDYKNREGTRKTLYIMAVILVAYWAVEAIVQQPGQIVSWLLLAMAAVLGYYVLREPRASNLKYTARYVESAPAGTASFDRDGVVIEDERGKSPFSFSDGVRVYEYKNVLAFDGGKRRFGMVPLDQLTPEDREAVTGLLNGMGRIEKVDQIRGLFGKNK